MNSNVIQRIPNYLFIITIIDRIKFFELKNFNLTHTPQTKPTHRLSVLVKKKKKIKVGENRVIMSQRNPIYNSA